MEIKEATCPEVTAYTIRTRETMANMGKTYIEILRHYYPGTTVGI